ncbi:MAG: alkaline phosphatase D family protein [Solirubrobacteraceae bacterium MAG38_C4-C5]|nr:alkaline phosphatase D family protein [Candidatus Siliceabacter maunaloa]
MAIEGNWNRGPISRRTLLTRAGIGTGALALYAAGFSQSKAWAKPFFAEDPFSLGVASGDPLPDGVVLWTRLAPEPLQADGGMPSRKVPVRYEVATDEGFRDVVRKGNTFATPELAHSVHVEVEGLDPAREYFYRFKTGPEESPVGRTLTAPPADADLALLQFAFVSCQNYPSGYFTPYRHIADEDLALVVHLGDYIYEGDGQGTIGRGHVPAAEIFTLADYRKRYGQYKGDEDLRAAHARHPFVVTWDDHEVENNYADEVPQDERDTERFLRRRADAYQAYYEHQPLRLSAKPQGPDMRLYRRLTYGRLAEFNVLDTRQYRSDQVGDEGRFAPEATMTGEAQERWLLDGLERSGARWNVLAQQVFFGERDFVAGPETNYSNDAWDGYVAARRRITGFLAERDTTNPIVLTGDVHANYVSNIERDFSEPESSELVATEFVTTSISTGGDGVDQSAGDRVVLAENPHIEFVNRQRGYVRCTLDRGQWRSDFRIVDFVTRPGAPIRTRASFVVEDGVPGAEEA